MDAVQTKVCGTCKAEKPITDFYKNKDGRYGVGFTCKNCDNKRKSQWHSQNRDKARKRDYEWRRNNPEKVKASAKKWRDANKDKKRADDAAWRAANPEKAKAKARRSSRNYRSNPKNRIASAMSSGIRSAVVHGDKGGRSTFKILGYTLDDLKAHLEKQFSPGMTWENYGKGGWHIDHKIPKSAFNYTSIEHIDFQRCWALSNLQPMWEPDNVKKGSKCPFGFQPSLPIAANDNLQLAETS